MGLTDRSLKGEKKGIDRRIEVFGKIASTDAEPLLPGPAFGPLPSLLL